MSVNTKDPRDAVALEEDPREPSQTSEAGVTRRSFLRGMIASGAVASMFPAISSVARAASPVVTPGVDLSNDKLKDMYLKMLHIRWYDRTVIDKMLTLPKFRGYCHPYCGEEASAVGVMSALNPDDWMQSYHRSHGHAIAKGVDIPKMAAEITFKATGTNKGYGGSMHIMQKSVYELGADGIVGPGAVIGAGAAWGLKARGKGQVAVTMGGDGHIASPYFHVALNEAALHKLPFIYVIENNQYQISHPYSDSTPLIRLSKAARGYEIPGVTVDGQDVLAVYSAMSRAVARARAGEGPTLIETLTYRYYDHFGDAGAKPGVLGAFNLNYRSNREVEHWLQRDPIKIFANTLIGWGVLTAEEASATESQAKQDIADAFAFADGSAVPKAEDAVKYVFMNGTVPARQLAATPLVQPRLYPMTSNG